jgi:hypothetical protein
VTLPNRVDPFGALVAVPERGRWLGNRGGRFHCPQRLIVPGRPYATRQWICCRLDFKQRRRQVWSAGYTELFFADEATALAAGHRPCFECRREDAVAFAAAWGRAAGTPPPRAPDMDAALHTERLQGRSDKRLHAVAFDGLPDGAMVAEGGAALRVAGDRLLPWSFAGYGPARPRPDRGMAQALTPPSILAVLRQGYRPREG